MTPLQLALVVVQAAIAAAKAATQGDPNAQEILGYLDVGDNAVNAAVGAIQLSKEAVNPSLLKPITPLE